MTDKVKHLIEWFAKNQEEIPLHGGIYNCPNTVNDPTELIYSEGGVRVWACHYYDYIEILGLTDDEFKDACKGIDELIFSEEEYNN